jgi:hypothetical protein
VVDRINQDISTNGSVYLFHIAGAPRIFTASGTDHEKLALTKEGDTVSVSYVASGESTVPVDKFDNLSLTLDKTAQQKEVENASAEKLKAEQTSRKAKDLSARLDKMKPDELDRVEEALRNK